MDGILRAHGLGNSRFLPSVTALPIADASQRGKTYRLLVAGTDDKVYTCRKKSDNTYVWTLWSTTLADLTTDSTHRLVTDTEKSAWNAKASTAVATTGVNGLMSFTDKTKLDGIKSGANVVTNSITNGNVTIDGVETTVYVHPLSHAPTMIAEDALHRFVTDTEKTTWNGKASTAVATTTANGLMSSADKSKLDGISTNAKKVAVSTTNGSILIDGTESVVYAHPINHPASIITQDANNRFVTDTEKTTWNGKASTAVATTIADGLMSSADKSKLDGVASGADAVAGSLTNGNILINGTDTVVYTHPTNHAPSIITQDANNRFVTDAEKTTWNGKASTAVATTITNGLMSATDKTKLDGIATGADAVAGSSTNGNILINGTDTVVYTHPTNHAGTMITEDATHRWFTDTERTKLNGIATGANVTADSATNGNIKIAGVETVVYTHPTNHAATMITEDASHRFVTDTEKSTWNGKASTAVATTTANGLMSSADKSKLDNLSNDYLQSFFANDRMECNVTSQSASIAPNSYVVINVAFVTAFTTPPVVVGVNGGQANVTCMISDVTTTGFKAYLKNWGTVSTSDNVRWIAVGH